MGDASPVSCRSKRHARRTQLDHSAGPLSMRFLCASPRKRLSCQLFQPGPSCDFSYCAWPCGFCLACFCAASFRTYLSRLFLLAYFFSFLVRRKFGLGDPPKIYRFAAFQNDFLMSAQRFFINLLAWQTGMPCDVAVGDGSSSKFATRAGKRHLVD